MRLRDIRRILGIQRASVVDYVSHPKKWRGAAYAPDLPRGFDDAKRVRNKRRRQAIKRHRREVA
jgi:hypothetical protein